MVIDVNKWVSVPLEDPLRVKVGLSNCQCQRTLLDLSKPNSEALGTMAKALNTL